METGNWEKEDTESEEEEEVEEQGPDARAPPFSKWKINSANLKEPALQDNGRVAGYTWRGGREFDMNSKWDGKCNPDYELVWTDDEVEFSCKRFRGKAEVYDFEYFSSHFPWEGWVPSFTMYSKRKFFSNKYRTEVTAKAFNPSWTRKMPAPPTNSLQIEKVRIPATISACLAFFKLHKSKPLLG
ncbi:hypothetical protein CYMTET_30548 [Cymbomonas tetramitiformis]|uniref:Uncharacterized protein n=1 Tax=Cymbomonas tetramitiformis TaxID=36881 RepID=A0AAE0KU33_9CHLO|nr:hypothetical protein CYMTET_30548 [Cymbomonas tetramitiformis]